MGHRIIHPKDDAGVSHSRRRKHERRTRKRRWPSDRYSTTHLDQRVDPRDPVRARANRRLLTTLIVLIVSATLILLIVQVARTLTSG
jgi:hypothetical protein